jgi:hypothetical protein
MLSTTNALRLASRRSLLSPSILIAPTSTFRHFSTTRPSFAAQEYPKTSTPSSPSEPTRSFQPHFADASQAVSRSAEEWKSSRPHEQWVMSHPGSSTFSHIRLRFPPPRETVGADFAFSSVVYKPDDLNVDIVHLEPKNASDRLAYALVRLARWGFDFVSGYKVRFPLFALFPLRFPLADPTSCLARFSRSREGFRSQVRQGRPHRTAAHSTGLPPLGKELDGEDPAPRVDRRRPRILRCDCTSSPVVAFDEARWRVDQLASAGG